MNNQFNLVFNKGVLKNLREIFEKRIPLFFSQPLLTIFCEILLFIVLIHAFFHFKRNKKLFKEQLLKFNVNFFQRF